VINIINYLLRDDNRDVMQPAKIVFTKEPQRVAVHNLKIYNVQLSRIKEMEEDFSNAWYCWFYAMQKADSEKKTIDEVVAMTPQLQEYSKRDAGFRQYCEQYGRVCSDPETREQYYWWIDGLMREEGIKHAAAQEDEQTRLEREKDLRETWLSILAVKNAELAEKDTKLAEKDTALAERDALIAELRAKISDNN
jgi:hypothetical protein